VDDYDFKSDGDLSYQRLLVLAKEGPFGAQTILAWWTSGKKRIQTPFA